MGSEHYCLRWNNHQSNLLGVFSQLLESESLVDVTLACTEGPSIRAHKVVLSACSSYFQTLFLDHPNRHPIVILKDVRFSELRTLVDFMYKGEVNVEYCQLSALLKTAESLKVKGLADMTNINAAASTREEQQQQQQQQQPPPPPPPPPQPAQPQPQQQHQQQQQHHLANDNHRDREHRDRERDRDKERERDRERKREREREREREPPESESCEQSQSQQQQQQQQRLSEVMEAVHMAECPASPGVRPESPCPGPLALHRPRRSSDDAVSLEETRGSLSPISVHSGPSDMSLSNNTSTGNTQGTVGPTATAQGTGPTILPIQLPQSRLPSPHSTEPLAGPSGLPPVQQVPLSLKKEVDWERSTDDRVASIEATTDYRLPPDPVSLALGLEVGGWGALLDRSSSSGSQAHQSVGVGLLSPGSLGALGSLTRRCGVCLAAFPSAWLLERHALLQHAGHPSDDKPFTCEQCGQRYRYRSAYVKHREQNHRARLPADKLFTCDVCGMQFRYLKSFKKHRLNHALERLHRVPESLGQAERSDQVSSTGEPSQAETASETSGTGAGEPEEMRPRESDPDPQTDENAPADCETAGVIAAAETEDGAPEEDRQEEDRPQDIAEVSDPTAALGLFRTHHRDPDRRERRFACPFCGKCVRSKENLKLHVRKHTGERPFVCLFCGRAFGGKSDLTRHLRIHTGERPYHCEMCGKCFARADYLSKHLTTHIHQR